MDRFAATVPVVCDSCGPPSTGEVYETVIEGRLHWVMDHSCPDGEYEAMGWDDTPDEWRQAILQQGGTYRLRLDGEIGGIRVAVLKVLRENGTALAAVQNALTTLGGDGLAGTEAELELLAARLREAGAATTLARES